MKFRIEAGDRDLENHLNTTSKNFALLADETMDVSTKKQLSICIRYFDNNEKKIIEDFLQFIQVNDVSGKGLTDTILKSISYFGLNPKFMIGLGYDGAAAMSGEFKGVKTRIREYYPLYSL